MKDKLAEEILIANKIQFERLKEEKPMLAYNIIEAMQAYHEAKMKEVTDEDIEVKAKIDYRDHAYSDYDDAYIRGAKAMRDGEIVSSNRDDMNER